MTRRHAPRDAPERPRRGVRTRATGALAALAVGSLTAVVVTDIGRAEPASTTPLVADATVAPAGVGTRPSMSGDGRWVVHEALDGERRTVVRVDLATGVAEELTPVPPGIRSGHTVRPSLSDDGCVVAVVTELPLDLFRDDDRSDRWDVYRHVVPECGGAPGAWELVSATAEGIARDGVSPHHTPAVSATGGTIAYTHPWGASIAAGPGARGTGVTAVSVVDLTVPLGDPSRTVPVPALPPEVPTSAYVHHGASAPSISGDGRRVAFVSDTTAHEAIPNWGVGAAPGDTPPSQVFVWDRDDPEPFTRVRLLSGVVVDGAVVPAPAGAGAPRISLDGRVVAFESADPGLDPEVVGPVCAEICPTQVLRVELDAGTDDPSARRTVTSGADGTAGHRSSSLAGLDADGGQVLVLTRADGLVPSAVPSGPADLLDVLVADTGTGTFRRVADAIRPGVPAAHFGAAMSRTGRSVVFGTAVAEFVMTGTLAPDDRDADTADTAASDTSIAGADESGTVTTGAPTAAGARARDLVVVSLPATLSAAPLDFGTVLVDWPSDELYVSVLNEGPGAFVPASITSSLDEVVLTDGGSCRPGIVVPVGGSCTVTAVFTPVEETASVGEITVAEAGHEAASISIPVAGSGGEPTLQAIPAGLDLPGGVVGRDGGSARFTIANVGWVAVDLASTVVDGRDAADFRILADGCSGRELAPRAECVVEVGFVPGGPNRRTAAVTVRTTTEEYTAVVVAGPGRYEPAMLVPEPVVDAGGDLGLALGGFPAGADVVLSFGDHGRPLAVVRTDDGGGALAVIDVPRRERRGLRDLVATGPDGTRASSEVEVLRPRGSSPRVPGTGYG